MKALVGGVVAGATAIGAGFIIGLTVGEGAVMCATGTPGVGSVPSTTVNTPNPSITNAPVAFKQQLGGAKANPVLWRTTAQAVHSQPRVVLPFIMGEYLEAKFDDHAQNPNPTGPGRPTSYGSLQVQDPIDGPLGPARAVNPDITIAQAEDPRYVPNYMAPRYQQAASGSDVNSAAAWATPEASEHTAEEIVFRAEKPADHYYAVQGAATVHQAFITALSIMSWLGIPTDFAHASAPASLLTGLQGDPGSGGCQSGSGGGTSGSQGFITVPPGQYQQARQQAVNGALSMEGKSYSYAGGTLTGLSYGTCSNDPNDAGRNDCHVLGIDCSGLTRYALNKARIEVPHSSETQYQLTSSFTVVHAGGDPTKAQIGDLVFFEGLDAPGHVAMYIGGGWVIQAPQSGDVVKRTKLSDMDPFTAITDPYAWWDAQKRSA